MNNNYFSQIWMNNNNFSRFRSIVKIRHFRLLCLVRMERKTNWKLTIKSQKRKLFYFFTIIVLLLNTPKILIHIFKSSYIIKQFDENLLILCTLVVWVYHLTRTLSLSSFETRIAWSLTYRSTSRQTSDLQVTTQIVTVKKD